MRLLKTIVGTRFLIISRRQGSTSLFLLPASSAKMAHPDDFHFATDFQRGDGPLRHAHARCLGVYCGGPQVSSVQSSRLEPYPDAGDAISYGVVQAHEVR